MISSYSQLSLDVLVKAAVGYGIGVICQTNEKLLAIVLATQSLAHFTLNTLGEAWLGKKLDMSAINETSRAISYLVAITVIKEAGLISLRMAGLLGFFTLGVYLANQNRIQWFKTETV